MRIKGRKVEAQYEDTIIFPRKNGAWVFKVKPVQSFEQFEKLRPLPEPPAHRRDADGNKIPNLKDEGFLIKMEEYEEDRRAWMAIESLKDNEIEWDTVDPSRWETWKNWLDDFKTAGFNQMEVIQLQLKILELNSMSTTAMEKARADFQAGVLVVLNEQDPPEKSEPLTSASGGPVKG